MSVKIEKISERNLPIYLELQLPKRNKWKNWREINGLIGYEGTLRKV